MKAVCAGNIAETVRDHVCETRPVKSNQQVGSEERKAERRQAEDRQLMDFKWDRLYS